MKEQYFFMEEVLLNDDNNSTRLITLLSTTGTNLTVLVITQFACLDYSHKNCVRTAFEKHLDYNELLT